MEQLKLPTSLVNGGNAMSLMRELNALNDFFVGAKVRQPGAAVQLPKTTKLLEQLAEINSVNLLEESQRQTLYQALEAIIKKAPTLHISFATEATPQAVEPILIWLRRNVHPQALLQTGLQPAIAAGCVLRTPNKSFDMSMRVHLQKQSHFLSELIAGTIHGQ